MCTDPARNRSLPQRAPRTRQAGLTMIEMIVFIIIVGVAVGGILGVMGLGAKRSAEPIQHKQALLIAEALIEEVSLAHFTFCHPDDARAEIATSAADCATQPETVGPGTALRPYFNVNDYVNAFGTPKAFSSAATIGPVTNAEGVQLYGTEYQASVTIRADATLGPAGLPVTGSGTADTDLLHISVRVQYGQGQVLVLDRYRTRYAPNSMP